jgi:hypothetical protein
MHLTPKLTVNGLITEIAKNRQVSKENVRLIFRGKVCSDEDPVDRFIDSFTSDFFIANIIYPRKNLPVEHLVSMGFSEEDAVNALKDTNGGINEAAELLLQKTRSAHRLP